MQVALEGQATAVKLPSTLGKACWVHAVPPFVVPRASAVP